MSVAAVTVESAKLKPGVLFLETLSGGVLMDIEADRFLALTPFSAKVWSSLSSGHSRKKLLDTIASAKGVDTERAESLLLSQLQAWERVELVGCNRQVVAVPQPKESLAMPRAELSMDAVASARLAPWLTALLLLVESKYRRAIAKQGLAKALVSLQREHGPLAKAPAVVIAATVRSYHLARRAFRQGNNSRDCLFRSLALAAVLRRHGIEADLCIGIIDVPFSSHAWVEAHGRVLNETLYNCERYRIIGRF
jgi:Transglutaminase-like superfamily